MNFIIEIQYVSEKRIRVTVNGYARTFTTKGEVSVYLEGLKSNLETAVNTAILTYRDPTEGGDV